MIPNLKSIPKLGNLPSGQFVNEWSHLNRKTSIHWKMNLERIPGQSSEKLRHVLRDFWAFSEISNKKLDKIFP
jgi:hypothetical protein